ncbi:MAG TPA: hypothetical protein DCS48_02435 [Desulfovibrio sp.]|nr:hypothetical protein [Desulfovibrio sp.]
MPRLSADKQAESTAPRGQEHYWAVMVGLDRSGEFTGRMVLGKTNTTKTTLYEYMRRLVKAGFLKVTREEKINGPIARKYYRIAKRSRFAPRIAKDGKVFPPPKRDHMWRAMRMNGEFTAATLMVWASTDEVDIKLDDSKDYIKHLYKAGYLKLIGKVHNTYKYRLIKNTGPLPPQVQKIKQVWDPNEKKVMKPKEEKS